MVALLFGGALPIRAEPHKWIPKELFRFPDSGKFEGSNVQQDAFLLCGRSEHDVIFPYQDAIVSMRSNGQKGILFHTTKVLDSLSISCSGSGP
jgi:hypothetical protein